MKRTASALLLALFAILAGTALGQTDTKPNFSGSWILDLKKSTSIAMVGGPKKNMRVSSRLQVEHNGPELKLVETLIWEELDKSGIVVKSSASPPLISVYYTDGRGEESVAFGKVKFHSITKWKGETLVVHRPEPQLISAYTEIAISLSKDGKELKIITEKILGPQQFGQSDTRIDQFSGKKVFVRSENAKTATSQ